MKSTLLFIMLFLTSACGYQLRGSTPLPEILDTIYLSNASTDLTNAFRKIYNDKLLKSSANATLVIKISNEKLSRHTISTDTSGYSNEFALIYQLNFDLVGNKGVIISKNQNIRLTKSYFNNQSGNTLLSKNKEEALLRKELYQQAVYTITSKARATLPN